MGAKLVVVIAYLTAFLCDHLALSRPFQARDGVLHVLAGQSIQEAINSAGPGTQITVGAGIYAEQLTITKDGISLVGEGAVLVPPNVAVQNTCTDIAGDGTEAGICVTGSGVELAPFEFDHQKVLSVAQTVKDVSITGFLVNGFNGENIAVVGGTDVHVSNNSLYNGETYGFLAAGSTNTIISKNSVVSEDTLAFIAICIDNFDSASVLNNHISGYNIGVCIQTSGAETAFNDISDSCIGAYIDPGIDSARVSHNHIGATHPDCVTQALIGLSIGVTVWGAVNSVVQSNVIQDQHAGGMAAGISVVDGFDFGPEFVATGNTVIDNVLFNNDVDIFVNTTGTGNVISQNQCSTPAEICS